MSYIRKILLSLFVGMQGFSLFADECSKFKPTLSKTKVSLCPDPDDNYKSAKGEEIKVKGLEDWTGSITYSWKKDGNVVSTSDSYIVKEGGTYQCEVISGNCRAYPQTEYIEPAPNLTLQGTSNLLCNGGQMQVTAVGLDNDKYKWEGPDIVANGGAATIRAAGAYTIEGEKNGCKVKMNFEIMKSDGVPVSIDGITALCKGDTETTLTAIVNNASYSSTYKYQWLDEDRNTVSSDKTATFNSTGNYELKVTDEDSKCKGSASFSIDEVTNIPKPSVNKTEACSGSSQTITAKGDNLSKFIWSGPGESIVGDSKSFLLSPDVTENCTISVVGVTEQGCKSDPYEFEVTIKKSPTLIIEQVYPCVGKPYTIKATGFDDSDANLVFKWEDIDSKDINRTLTETTTIEASLYDKTTKCEASQIIKVEFVKAPKIDISGISEVCEGSIAVITATTKGTGDKTKYEWTNESGAVVSSDSVLRANVAGVYKFTANVERPGYDCPSSVDVPITVNPLPTLSLSADKLKLCSGDESVITAASDAAVDKIVWGKKTGADKGKTYTAKSAGWYYATATSDKGCVKTDSLEIKSLSNLVVKAKFDPICDGETDTITLESTDAFSAKWADNTTEKTHDFTTDTPLEVEVEDEATHCVSNIVVNPKVYPVPKGSLTLDKEKICKGDVAIATAQYTIESKDPKENPTLSYKWDNGTESGKRAFEVEDGEEHSLEVVSSLGGCKAEAKIKATVKELPTVAVSAPAKACEGDEIEFTLGGADSYEFFRNSVESPYKTEAFGDGETEYLFYGTDATTGCVGEGKATVNISRKFNVGVDGSDFICKGKTAELTAKGADSYTWEIGDAKENADKYVFSATTEYVLIGSKTDNVCSDTFTGKVTLLEEVILTLPEATNMCDGGDVEIEAGGDGVTSFRWTKDGETTVLATTAAYTATAEGKYNVVGITSGGCESKPYDIEVKKVNKPTVEIVGRAFFCNGESEKITANATSDAAGEITYSWSNGADTKDIDVDSEGTYIVTVTDANFCTNTAEQTMTKQTPVIKISDKREFCTDSTLTLTASNMDKYYWNGVDEKPENSSASIDIKSEEVDDTKEVSIVAYDADGCKAEETVTVTKRPVPTLDLNSETVYCENSETEVLPVPSVEMSYYLWDGVKQTSAGKMIGEEREYKVIGHDLFDCPTKEYTTKGKKVDLPTVSIDADDYICEAMDGKDLTAVSETATEYKWTGWSEKKSDKVLHVNADGVYTVIAYIGNCESQPAQITIHTEPKPVVAIDESPSLEFCHLEDKTLHAQSSTAVSYSWDEGLYDTKDITTHAPGIHTVTAIDAKGCEATASVEMIEKPGPQTLRTEGLNSICQYDRATLTAFCSDCDSMVWSTGAKSVDFATENAIQVETNGDYYVIGYSKIGCASDTVRHPFIVSPAPVVVIEGETQLMSDDETTLTATIISNSVGPFRYLWTPTKEYTESIDVKSEDVDLFRNYSVTVTDAAGCTGVQMLTVTKVAIRLKGRTEICEDESAEMSVEGKDLESAVWIDGLTGVELGTDNSIKLDDEGMYKVIVTQKDGMKDTLTFGIKKHAYPKLDLVGKDYFCYGDSTYIGSSIDEDVKKIVWNTGDVDSFIHIRKEGQYVITAENIYGCASSDTMNIYMKPLPNVEILGADTLIEGTVGTLTASGAKTYHWLAPDTTDTSLDIDTAGTYRLLGTDEFGCRNTAVKEVRLIPIPHPLINDTVDGSAKVCDGELFKLIASGGETYLWDTGETTDTIYVSESRIYRLTACLSNGQCREQTFSVEFVPRPRVIKITGETIFCPEGETELTAVDGGDVPIERYEWNTGETTQSVKAKKDTLYSVLAYSEYGCPSDTLRINLSYYERPTISLKGSFEICSGSSTVLTASGGERYLWNESGNTAATETFTAKGNYALRVWNEHDCYSDTLVYVKELPNPEIRIVQSKELCEGDSAVLSLTGDRFKETYYYWSSAEETDSITIKKPVTYTAKIYNGYGCEANASLDVVLREKPRLEIEGKRTICIGEEATLSAQSLTSSSVTNYWWNSVELSKEITVSTAGRYVLVATDEYGCVSDSVEAVVEVVVPSGIEIAGDFHICVEREDTATVWSKSTLDDAVAFSWYDSDGGLICNSQMLSAITEGKYRVETTDKYGCKNSAEIEIAGVKNPVVSIKGAEIPVCGKDFARLSVSANEKVSLLWNNGSTSDFLDLTESGEVSVMATNIHGCYDSASVDLIFNDIPALRISDTLGFCRGNSVSVGVEGADRYKWNNGSTSNFSEYDAPQSAFVIGYDDYGCEKRIDFDVYEYPMPNTMLIASPVHISRTDPTVNFKVDGDTLVLPDCSYDWRMSDGGEESDKEFSYSFDVTSQKRFGVSLAVTTLEGCIETHSIQIDCELDIPNTITPNGDGINDHFMKGCVVEIYDRHDILIYKGDDGWDGHLRNGEVTADTYYYVLTDVEDEKHYGFITVIVRR